MFKNKETNLIWNTVSTYIFWGHLMTGQYVKTYWQYARQVTCMRANCQLRGTYEVLRGITVGTRSPASKGIETSHASIITAFSCLFKYLVWILYSNNHSFLNWDRMILNSSRKLTRVLYVKMLQDRWHKMRLRREELPKAACKILRNQELKP